MKTYHTTFNLLATFFRGIFYSYLVIITFAHIAFLLVGTGFETILTFFLSITPGVGLGKNGTFRVNNDTVVTFFTFWGIVSGIVGSAIENLSKKNFSVEKSHIFQFVTLLHVISFIKSYYLFGIGAALTFTLTSYLIFLSFSLFYGLVNFPKMFINNN